MRMLTWFSRRAVMTALALGLIAAVAPAAQANSERPDPNEARRFIQSMTEQAVAVLARTDIDPDEQRRLFSDLLEDRFNLPFLAGLSLGPYRPVRNRDGVPGKTPTEGQYETYLSLFGDFVLSKYSSLLGSYSGESVEVLAARERGRRDMVVQSRVVSPDGSAVAVTWQVRSYDGKLKIIDIQVANVSMVVSQREEFGSVIRRGGFDALLDLLRRHNADASTASG